MTAMAALAAESEMAAKSAMAAKSGKLDWFCAAGLVGALLGLAPAAAAVPTAPEPPSVAGALVAGWQEPRPAVPPEVPARAAVTGRVESLGGHLLAGVPVVARRIFDGLERWETTAEDGRFAFGDLAAGTYVLEAVAAGYDIEPQEALALAPGDRLDVRLSEAPEFFHRVAGRQDLRSAIADSALIVEATTGASVASRRHSHVREIELELTVSRVIAGSDPGQVIRVRHDQPLEMAAGERYPPGETVLAFLGALEEGDGESVFDSVVHEFSVRRVQAMVRTADLTAWLNGTAGDAATRDEAALSILREGLLGTVEEEL
jgi:hypothetical protein